MKNAQPPYGPSTPVVVDVFEVEHLIDSQLVFSLEQNCLPMGGVVGLQASVLELADDRVEVVCLTGVRQLNAYVTDHRIPQIIAVVVETRVHLDVPAFGPFVTRHLHEVVELLLQLLAEDEGADLDFVGDLDSALHRHLLGILMAGSDVETVRVHELVLPFQSVVVVFVLFRCAREAEHAKAIFRTLGLSYLYNWIFR